MVTVNDRRERERERRKEYRNIIPGTYLGHIVANDCCIPSLKQSLRGAVTIAKQTEIF